MHPRDAGGVLHHSLGKVLFFSSLPSLLPLSLQASSHLTHPSCCSLLITLFLPLLTTSSLFCSSFLSDLPFDSLPLLCLCLDLPLWLAISQLLVSLLKPSSSFLSSLSILLFLSSIFHLALHLTNRCHFSQLSFQALKWLS